MAEPIICIDNSLIYNEISSCYNKEFPVNGKIFLDCSNRSKIDWNTMISSVRCQKLSHFCSHTAVVFPLPGPILAIVVDKYRYIVSGLPNYSCMSQDSDFIFYSLVLVLDILLASSVCLSIVTLWVVHKVCEPLADYSSTSWWQCIKEIFERCW